jgi:hypothetical protein
MPDSAGTQEIVRSGDDNANGPLITREFILAARTYAFLDTSMQPGTVITVGGKQVLIPQLVR